MLYVEVNENEILNITDQEVENFEKIDVDTRDSAIDLFTKKKWKYDEEEIVARLESLFPDEEENNLEVFDIKVSTINRSFSELADMFQEGDIKSPDVQRKFVWDTNKCSKLIESILLGLPIPPLFFMDNGNSVYEVIDGLQRLTTISNYILGNSWGQTVNDVKRNRVAKLSQNVDKTIAGKSFNQLTPEQQKKIKRAAVTVIDFRQIEPSDDKAKYLIFERINTGSELLNAMQIRKALAYGAFITDLYETANNSDVLKSIFGKQYINKDKHVEFLLGVYVTYKVFKNEYQLPSQYQKYILNDYCENNKDKKMDTHFIDKFDKTLNDLNSKFKIDELFKKVNSNGDFHGNRNNNIAESLIATTIICNSEIPENVFENYKKYISRNIENFSTNQITIDRLNKRRKICENILEISDEKED
ncbi:MAG: DUF262 domain-containing protein [Streptococcus sp.]|nr:DUF262 domain-containing protein [Streptococcus sp.]